MAEYPEGSYTISRSSFGKYHTDDVVSFANHPLDSNIVYVTGNTNAQMESGVHMGKSDAFVSKIVNGSVAWTRQFGSNDTDTVGGIAIDPRDFSVVVTGYTKGVIAPSQVSKGLDDIFLARFNQNGSMTWISQDGTNDTDVAKAIAIAADGSIYITGKTRGPLHGQHYFTGTSFYIMCVNPNGTHRWTREWGSLTTHEGLAITVSAAGNVFAVGTTGGGLNNMSTNGQNDAILVKVDANGQNEQFTSWGTTSGDLVYSVTVDSQENVYVCGDTAGDFHPNNQTNRIGSSIFVSKILPNGQVKYTSQFGGISTGIDACRAIDIDASASTLLIGGWTNGGFGGVSPLQGIWRDQSFVAKLDPGTGHLFWINTFGNPGQDAVFDLKITPANSRINKTHIVVVGKTGRALNQLNDYKLDGYMRSLDLVNNASFISPITMWTSSGCSNDHANGVTHLSNNDIVAVGNTKGVMPNAVGASSNAGNNYFHRVSSTGYQQWTVQEETEDKRTLWGVTTDAQDNIYSTGFGGQSYYTDLPNGNIFGLVEKRDRSGKLIWLRNLTVPYATTTKGYAITFLPPHSVWAVAEISGFISKNGTYGSPNGILVTQFHTNGTKLFQERYADTSARPTGMATLPDNSAVFISGHTTGTIDGSTSSGQQDFFLTKYLANTTRIWTKVYGSFFQDYALGIAIPNNGNHIYLGGYELRLITNPFSIRFDGTVKKINASTGALIYSSNVDSPAFTLGTAIAVDPDDQYVFLAGHTQASLARPNAGKSDVFVARFLTNGTRDFVKQWGTAENDYVNAITLDNNLVASIVGFSEGRLDKNSSAEIIGHQNSFISSMRVQCLAGDIQVEVPTDNTDVVCVNCTFEGFPQLFSALDQRICNTHNSSAANSTIQAPKSLVADYPGAHLIFVNVTTANASIVTNPKPENVYCIMDGSRKAQAYRVGVNQYVCPLGFAGIGNHSVMAYVHGQVINQSVMIEVTPPEFRLTNVINHLVLTNSSTQIKISGTNLVCTNTSRDKICFGHPINQCLSFVKLNAGTLGVQNPMFYNASLVAVSPLNITVSMQSGGICIQLPTSLQIRLYDSPQITDITPTSLTQNGGSVTFVGKRMWFSGAQIRLVLAFVNYADLFEFKTCNLNDTVIHCTHERLPQVGSAFIQLSVDNNARVFEFKQPPLLVVNNRSPFCIDNQEMEPSKGLRAERNQQYYLPNVMVSQEAFISTHSAWQSFGPNGTLSLLDNDLCCTSNGQEQDCGVKLLSQRDAFVELVPNQPGGVFATQVLVSWRQPCEFSPSQYTVEHFTNNAWSPVTTRRLCTTITGDKNRYSVCVDTFEALVVHKMRIRIVNQTTTLGASNPAVVSGYWLVESQIRGVGMQRPFDVRVQFCDLAPAAKTANMTSEPINLLPCIRAQIINVRGDSLAQANVPVRIEQGSRVWEFPTNGSGIVEFRNLRVADALPVGSLNVRVRLADSVALNLSTPIAPHDRTVSILPGSPVSVIVQAQESPDNGNFWTPTTNVSVATDLQVNLANRYRLMLSLRDSGGNLVDGFDPMTTRSVNVTLVSSNRTVQALNMVRGRAIASAMVLTAPAVGYTSLQVKIDGVKYDGIVPVRVSPGTPFALTSAWVVNGNVNATSPLAVPAMRLQLLDRLNNIVTIGNGVNVTVMSGGHSWVEPLIPTMSGQFGQTAISNQPLDNLNHGTHNVTVQFNPSITSKLMLVVFPGPAARFRSLNVSNMTLADQRKSSNRFRVVVRSAAVVPLPLMSLQSIDSSQGDTFGAPAFSDAVSITSSNRKLIIADCNARQIGGFEWDFTGRFDISGVSLSNPSIGDRCYQLTTKGESTLTGWKFIVDVVPGQAVKAVLTCLSTIRSDGLVPLPCQIDLQDASGGPASLDIPVSMNVTMVVRDVDGTNVPLAGQSFIWKSNRTNSLDLKQYVQMIRPAAKPITIGAILSNVTGAQLLNPTSKELLVTSGKEHKLIVENKEAFVDIGVDSIPVLRLSTQDVSGNVLSCAQLPQPPTLTAQINIAPGVVALMSQVSLINEGTKCVVTLSRTQNTAFPSMRLETTYNATVVATVVNAGAQSFNLASTGQNLPAELTIVTKKCVEVKGENFVSWDSDQGQGCACDRGFRLVGAVTCEACPVDTYSALPGLRDQCVTCPYGNTEKKTGSNSLESCRCNPNEYFADNKCLGCPKNFQCDGFAFRVNAGFFPNDLNSTQAFACPVRDACGPGGVCRPAYTGTLCSECAKGFGRSNSECVACNDLAVDIGLLLIGTVAALVLITWVVQFYMKNSRITYSDSNVTETSFWAAPPMLLVKILLNHLQAISVFTIVDVKWSSESRALFQLSNSANLALEMAPLNCAFDNPLLSAKFFGYAALPIFTLVLALIVRGVQLTKKAQKKQVTMMDIWMDVRKRVLPTVRIIAFLIHLLMLRTTVEILSGCRRFGSAYVLREDTRLKCDSPEFVTTQVFVGIVGGLEVIGLPALILWRLTQYYNKNSLGDRQVWDGYHFFYDSYLPKRFWYDWVILARKSALVAVAVIFVDQPLVQLYVGSSVMLVALVVQQWLSPYRYFVLTLMENLSLMVALGTLQTGMLAVQDTNGEAVNELASGIIVITLNVIYVSVIGLMITLLAGKKGTQQLANITKQREEHELDDLVKQTVSKRDSVSVKMSSGVDLGGSLSGVGGDVESKRGKSSRFSSNANSGVDLGGSFAGVGGDLEGKSTRSSRSKSKTKSTALLSAVKEDKKEKEPKMEAIVEVDEESDE